MLCKILKWMTNKRLVWFLAKERKINVRQFSLKKSEKGNRSNIKNNNKNPRNVQKKNILTTREHGNTGENDRVHQRID